jgi:CheY-like chemotaxis protein
MSEETQQSIFDPFFTTKPEGKGTGLGLSTVYGIVRQLRGTITVSSKLGYGTRFEIYLPRLGDEVVVPPKEQQLTGSVDGSETVLVVEDQEPVRHLAVSVLKEHGYRVLEASQGEEALALTERHDGPIHLLLTDVIMPYMTGRALADRLKIARPETKLLYMSGYGTEVITNHGLLEPNAPYLAKPFTPDALVEKVREVLGPHQPRPVILVADDEESVRSFYRRVLSGAGYEVVDASDGAEALQKSRERRFDLLLTDLVMPEREGLELIMVLREEQPQLKIVAISGAFGGTFLKPAEFLGAAVTLLKPVSPDQLLSVVKDALQAQR